MAPGVDECVVRDVKLCGSQLGPVLGWFSLLLLRKQIKTLGQAEDRSALLFFLSRTTN